MENVTESPGITLSPDQQSAVSTALDEPRSLLIGEGGTGKSVCLAEIAKSLMSDNHSVLMLAPTNKAAKRLRDAMGKAGIDSNARLSIKTVASALGLRMLPTSEVKHPSRVSAGCVENYSVVIVDEVSMLGDIAWNKYLLPELIERNIQKIVLCGDEYQLPPVKEQKSPVFGLAWPTSKLQQVHRFDGGSALAQVTTYLRDHLYDASPVELDMSGLTVVRPADYRGKLVNCFAEATQELGDELPMTALAWTNARVDEVNTQMRQRLVRKDGRHLPFTEGELAVVARPVVQVDDQGEIIDSLFTDQVVQVERIEDSFSRKPAEVTKYLDDEEPYPAYELTLKTMTGKFKVWLPRDTGIARWNKDLDTLHRAAMAHPKLTGSVRPKPWWPEYHALNEVFADLRYAYSLTVHRSQGSTYERVAVDAINISKNRNTLERRKLLYVALSRGSKEVIVNQAEVTV